MHTHTLVSAMVFSTGIFYRRVKLNPLESTSFFNRKKTVEFFSVLSSFSLLFGRFTVPYRLVDVCRFFKINGTCRFGSYHLLKIHSFSPSQRAFNRGSIPVCMYVHCSESELRKRVLKSTSKDPISVVGCAPLSWNRQKPSLQGVLFQGTRPAWLCRHRLLLLLSRKLSRHPVSFPEK